MMGMQSQRRKKSNDICGKNFLKFVIYVFTFFFWLTGFAFLALGLWIKLAHHSYISLLGNPLFPVATYLMIATGGFILLSGIIGCAGACLESRCPLVMYAIFLLLIFLVEAVSGVLAYMYEGIIKEELTRSLNSTMMKNYKFDAEITKAIDEMQTKFQCCGAKDFKDWKRSEWRRNNVYQAPDSCCISTGPLCGNYSEGPSNIHYMGCSQKLQAYTKDNLIIIGGVGLGLCCVQIIGLIFSCCLVRKIKDKKYRY
ncbi:hypothetical protein FSP39_019586 [Pinctada imbricata]|uniref:Tetraspanin n=1 Tax=Pinctada imbricata TaxID=66713 RepID=A0AA89C879_PINIB|nr:hypothetical protein FSP39_019586 [Pinctada imbricata]